MEEQGSIVLQKKMILALFTIIFTIMSGIYVVGNNFKNYEKMAVASGSEVVESNTNMNENDIILIEQITYAAVEEISEEIVEDEQTTSVEIDKVSELEEKIQIAKNDRITSQTVSRKKAREDTILEKAETVSEVTSNSVGENENQKENTTKYVSYKSLAEDNPPEEYSSVVEVSATAYCLCKKCCGKSPSNPNYGMTASGIRIVPGSGIKVIAVDPKIIPLGSKVYVEGLNGAWDYGYATASDTGSAIKDYKIDLYMDTHSEALTWGRKKVNVYVID